MLFADSAEILALNSPSLGDCLFGRPLTRQAINCNPFTDLFRCFAQALALKEYTAVRYLCGYVCLVVLVLSKIKENNLVLVFFYYGLIVI